MMLRILLLSVFCLLFCSACTNMIHSPAFSTVSEIERAFPVRMEPEKNPRDCVLDLKTAARIALHNNPDWQSAAFAVKAAKYRWYASLSGYLPRVSAFLRAGQSLNDTYNRRNPPSDVLRREDIFSVENSLSVSYLVFDGLEREFNALAAKESFLAEQANRKDVRRLLLRAVAYAYYDCVCLRELIRIHEADQDFQEAALRQARDRYDSGHIPLDNVLNFQLLRTSAESSLLNARYQYETACYAFCALLGVNEDFFPECAPLDPENNPDLCFPIESVCLELAVQNRPDLEQARRDFYASRSRSYAAYAGLLPSLTAYTNFGFSTNAARVSGEEHSRYYYNATLFEYGIRTQWDLFSGYSTVQLIRERSAIQQIAFFRVREKFLQLAAEVRSARADCRNASRQVQLYHDMMELARRQRDLVSGAYQSGKETVTRLDQAQSHYVICESNYVTALAELGRSCARLRAAIAADS